MRNSASSGGAWLQQLSMQIGVTGQNPQQHDTLTPQLDDLGDGGIRVVIADNDELALLEPHAGCGMAHVRMCQASGVHPMEVDPQVPRRHLVRSHHLQSTTGLGSAGAARSIP